MLFACILGILGSVLFSQSGPGMAGFIRRALRSERTDAVPSLDERLFAEDPSSKTAAPDALGAIDNLPVATHLGEWVSLGPTNYGGKVHALAIDPTDENIVFAAYGCYSDLHSTNGTGAGLWRTQNGGKSWQPAIPADEDPCVLSVDVHQQQPNFVVAGLRGWRLNRHPGDVRLSRDGGDTWESIGPPASDPALHVFAVKFDIADPNTIYAATHSGLFKTSNTGQDWVKVLDYSGTGFFPDAPSLAMHPTDPSTLLLAVSSLGVQRSSDGGANWIRVDDAMDQWVPITVLAWARANPDIVYAERISPHRSSSGHTDEMFTYRSDDAGQSWTPTTNISNQRHQSRYDMSIAVDPSDDNHVIIGNSEMLYSMDGLLTFHTVLPPPPHPHVDHLAIAFAPSNPSIVYNGNDGGVWKSNDGGLSWRRADRGIRANHVSSFAVYRGSGIVNLSAGDYGAIVYDPQDPQENGWHNSDCGNEYRSNYASDAEHAYYGGGGTTPLTRIGDADRDCQLIDPAPAESRAGHIPMAFDPTNADTIYAGLGHIWKSTDDGTSWTSIGIEPVFQAGRHINFFQVAPSDGQTLYAVSNQNANLWATHDGGDSWAPVNTTAFASPRALAVMPGDAHWLYVGTDLGSDDRHGLFRSRDGGVNFEKLTGFPDNLPVNKITIDPQNEARLFVATGRGVLLSEDCGASWAQLGERMPRGIVVDESLVDGTLYVSSDQGLWSMALSGGGACEQPVTVLPKQLAVGSSGGTVRVDISIVSGCSWSVIANADWVQFETYGQQKGAASVDVNVQSNPGDTRQTIIAVAGQPIPLKQFGGVDPIGPEAVIAISIAGDCLTSVGIGDVLELQTCDPSNPDQRFRLEAIRPLLYHLVTASNKCLDTRKTRLAGTRLRKDTCMGEGEAHQLFELVQDESGWRLRGNLAGRTQGPEGYTLMCQERNGDHLEQQLCSDSKQQRFQVATVQGHKG